jgi:hypothetical protein
MKFEKFEYNPLFFQKKQPCVISYPITIEIYMQ